MAFQLNLLDNAKICDSNCNVKNNYAVFCVGCGRSCHLECHKAPDQLITLVSAVPKANRQSAYYGEASYTRLICDNCANLINSNVPNGSKPCFLTMFNEIAKKESEVMTITDTEQQNAQRPTTKKRKSDTLVGESDKDEDPIGDLQRLVKQCLFKLDKVERATTQTLPKQLNEIDAAQKSTVAAIESNAQALDKIGAKIEQNVGYVDDGMQKGFNKLTELTEKLYTPMNTPHRVNQRVNGRPSSLRQRAINNAARNDTPNRTPKSSGPILPTESDTATDENLFGPAVPRKLVFSGPDQRPETGKRHEFRHEQAIFIRYVNPSITPGRMAAILNTNAKIKEANEQNSDSIEITRLVRKSLSEDDISRRRSVSYRTGCTTELYPLISDKQMWASHWEIRQWDKNYGANDNGQHNVGGNFRTQEIGQQSAHT